MNHYFISISLLDSSTTTNINASYSFNRSSIHITEYYDFSSTNPADNVDVQPMFFSDNYEKMDDDYI